MDLCEDLADSGEGGVIRADIRAVLPGRCADNTDFRIRYVGVDPPHQEGPGGGSTISSRGG